MKSVFSSASTERPSAVPVRAAERPAAPVPSTSRSTSRSQDGVVFSFIVDNLDNDKDLSFSSSRRTSRKPSVIPLVGKPMTITWALWQILLEASRSFNGCHGFCGYLTKNTKYYLQPRSPNEQILPSPLLTGWCNPWLMKACYFAHLMANTGSDWCCGNSPIVLPCIKASRLRPGLFLKAYTRHCARLCRWPFWTQQKYPSFTLIGWRSVMMTPTCPR